MADSNERMDSKVYKDHLLKLEKEYVLLKARMEKIQQTFVSEKYQPMSKQIQHEIWNTVNTNMDNSANTAKSTLEIRTNLGYSLTDINNTISKLDHVFLDLATMDQKRVIAATTIARYVRGLVVRLKYKQFLVTLGSWRKQHAKPFIYAVEVCIRRQKQMRRTVELMLKRRKVQFTQNVLQAWFAFTKAYLAIFTTRRLQAEDLYAVNLQKLVRHMLGLWSSAAIGPRSRKQMKLRYAKRLQKARAKLESLKRYSVITSEMVKDEIYRQIIRDVRQRHEYHVFKMVFREMVANVYLPYKEKMETAKNHYGCRLVYKTMNMWICFQRLRETERKTTTTDKPTQPWERFQITHNLNKYIYYYENKLINKQFAAWRTYSTRHKEVRKRFEASTQRSLLHVLRSLRILTKHQRNLRALVVSEWKEHCTRIILIPLRMWIVYASRRKERHNSQRALVQAYQQKVNRQMRYSLFRGWKHQALYGHVTGIHSKLELITTLEEQKLYCLSLEATCQQYELTIKEFEKRIEEEGERTTSKQTQYETEVNENESNRLALHHAQEQISLLQSMISAIEIMHPSTVRKIKEHLMDDENDCFNLELLELAKEENTTHKSNPASVGGSAEEDMIQTRLIWAIKQASTNASESPNDSMLVGALSDTEAMSLVEFVKSGDPNMLAEPFRNMHVPSISENSKISLVQSWGNFVMEAVKKYPKRQASTQVCALDLIIFILFTLLLGSSFEAGGSAK